MVDKKGNIIMTVRIPEELWKRLSYARIERKIKSIQDAAIEGFEKILKEKGGAKKK